MTAWRRRWQECDLKFSHLFTSATRHLRGALKLICNAHNCCCNNGVARKRGVILGCDEWETATLGVETNWGAGHGLPVASRSTRRLFPTVFIDSYSRPGIVG
ncbi:hypothetical protein IG631_10318 [Alternaria alternata]|nr:hypothetical protein IG631_10318 [Alternaria alternata]